MEDRIIDARFLESFTAAIFRAHDIPQAVADTVANALVLANLKGHDSHGVIRIVNYVEWHAKGFVDPHGRLEVVKDGPGLLIVDGGFQFGQVIGREATRLALKKTADDGHCILTIRRSGHLGRIGEYAEMAAARGVVCLSLTNTHGGGVLAAPHGGREARLSANPISGGAPLPDGGSVIMDISTCVVAEGKLKVARAAGKKIPPGSIVDGAGTPTEDPNDFYADPPGAILPIAGHKGYALALFCDILAGAVGGGSCSRDGVERIANGWFSVFIDPEAFCGRTFFDEQVGALAEWVKSSKPMKGFDGVLLPGDPEAAALARRTDEGIPIAAATWQSIARVAEAAGVSVPPP